MQNDAKSAIFMHDLHEKQTFLIEKEAFYAEIELKLV